MYIGKAGLRETRSFKIPELGVEVTGLDIFESRAGRRVNVVERVSVAEQMPGSDADCPLESRVAWLL